MQPDQAPQDNQQGQLNQQFPGGQTITPPPQAMPPNITPQQKKSKFSFTLPFMGKKSDAPPKPISTQSALNVSEIRDGLVIMRDGSLRSVILCQSINFDLMSPQERESVEFNYQGFLNALYFPVQIFIRSQRVDLKQYLMKLGKIRAEQDQLLLGMMMEEYIEYVRYLIEAANVMDKQFYIIVPYYPPLTSQEGLATGLRKLSNLVKPKSGPVVINETDFNRYKAELTQRVQVILNGMNQLGVQAVPLNTQELIELYYSAYNPQIATQQRLTDVEQLEVPVVTRGTGPAPAAGEQT